MQWEQFRCNVDCEKYPKDCISENLFIDMIDRLADDGWIEYGYDMINIDDCWMTHDRDANGKLYPDPQRFPHGIKYLADYAHSKGVKLGIYNDYGKHTCGGYTGSEGYLLDDARTFAEWEVDYLKMDGCYSELLDQHDAYPAMARFLNETGRKIVYSCSWPAYDLDMDYAPLPPNCNLWRNWDDIECNWRSIKSIMDKFGNNTKWAEYAGPGHWNDADMIVAGLKGGTLTEDESKSHFAVWSILASPLIMSNDLRELPAWAVKILRNKEIIAVDQDVMGKQGIRVTPFEEQRSVWARPLANGDIAVALHNHGDEVVDIPLDFAIVGTASKYSIRDLYEHEELGVFTDSYVAKQVPVHGVQMLRMTPEIGRASCRERV